MKDKFIACMCLHALGDTIGFKNSEWEMMMPSSDPLEKVYQWVGLGGYSAISFKGWVASDDTILHMKTALALLENYESLNSLCKCLIKHYISAYDQFHKETFKYRNPGVATLESLKSLADGQEWDKMAYNIEHGGSGASMRNLCIGLAYYGESRRDKLVQISIETSRLTHNSTTGYLGGFASALFAALAIEEAPIEKWPFMLIELIENKVKSYIRTSKRDVEYFERDAHIFIDKWMKYIEHKFVNQRLVIRKSSLNLRYRNDYYLSNFARKLDFEPVVNKFTSQRVNYARKIDTDSTHTKFIGSGGDDSVIIAYDALVDSGNNFERLIYYSMLHMGDTDTTGCIAAGLYGALYGMENIPSRFLDDLEYKSELKKIASDLYSKYKLDKT